jgi:hypothetical protein
MEESRLFTVALSVDSRSRTATDSDNDFTVDFARLKNIVRIQLETVEVPNTLYAIDGAGNVLDFEIDSVVFATTITAGTYNGTELAALIQAGMRAAATNGTIVCTFDEKTNFFTFSITTNTFDLLAATGTSIATGIWAAIGFDAVDFNLISTSVQGQNTAQIKTGENYLLLSLKGYGSLMTTDMDDDVFAKLSMDDIATFRELISIPKTYSASSPLPYLSCFNVKLKRRDGTYYNLRNHPWSFTLSIEYLQ